MYVINLLKSSITRNQSCDSRSPAAWLLSRPKSVAFLAIHVRSCRTDTDFVARARLLEHGESDQLMSSDWHYLQFSVVQHHHQRTTWALNKFRFISWFTYYVKAQQWVLENIIRKIIAKSEFHQSWKLQLIVEQSTIFFQFWDWVQTVWTTITNHILVTHEIIISHATNSFYYESMRRFSNSK